MGETVVVALEELEDIVDDDGLKVDLFLVVQVFSLQLNLEAGLASAEDWRSECLTVDMSTLASVRGRQQVRDGGAQSDRRRTGGCLLLMAKVLVLSLLLFFHRRGAGRSSGNIAGFLFRGHCMGECRGRGGEEGQSLKDDADDGGKELGAHLVDCDGGKKRMLAVGLMLPFISSAKNDHASTAKQDPATSGIQKQLFLGKNIILIIVRWCLHAASTSAYTLRDPLGY